MHKFISALPRVANYFGMVAIVIMMTVTLISVIGRAVGHHLLGNVELVQMMLLVLIMSTLSYAESKDRHIKVGLIVDHLPKPVQLALDLFNYAATFIFALIVAYGFVLDAVRQKNVSMETTLVYGFPFYILKIVVVIGFALWAIEAINRIYVRVKTFRAEKNEVNS